MCAFYSTVNKLYLPSGPGNHILEHTLPDCPLASGKERIEPAMLPDLCGKTCPVCEEIADPGIPMKMRRFYSVARLDCGPTGALVLLEHISPTCSVGIPMCGGPPAGFRLTDAKPCPICCPSGNT